MILATLLLSGLLAAEPARPAPDVTVEAGTIAYDAGAERYRLLGGARLQQGGAVLRAGEATYDARTGEIRAGGGVLLTDPTRVVAADSIRAVLGGAFEAERVRAYLKATPADLAALETPEAARAAGLNALSLSGDRLIGEPGGRLRLLGARLTLCDCGEGPPSWEVRAREADVLPGVRAILKGPVVYVTPRLLLVNRPVPVLWLPWLYLPLGERQTGLLLPELDATGATGPVLGLPLFVTLGRSADLTLTPEWTSGGDRVRGLGARLELRWAPAAEAAGRLELTFIDDRRDEADGVAGARLALDGGHAARLGARTDLHARVQLASDPHWPRDFAADVLAREAGYQRSSLLLSHRRDGVVLEAGAAWLQPFGGSTEGYGPFGADRDGAHRLPGLSAVLLPASLGPLAVEGRAGLARLAPLRAEVDASGRPAATRADGRLELALPVLLGDALSVRPYVRGAGAAYAFEDGGDPVASGWGLAGLALSTELSRRLGAVRHAVSPRVEWRAGSAVEGEGLRTAAYDAFDRTAAGVLSAAPPGSFHQLRLAVETRLSAGAQTPLRLEVGQDLDLRAGRSGETFAAVAISAGPLWAEGSARLLAIDERAEPAPTPAFESGLDRFTELTARLRLSLGRHLALRGGMLAVGPGGSSPLLAGPDALFDLRPAAIDGVGKATAGGRAVLGPATLDYEALLAVRRRLDDRCGDTRRIGAGQVLEQAASFTWDSPCRCFRVALRARLNHCGELSYGATLELARPGAVR